MFRSAMVFALILGMSAAAAATPSIPLMVSGESQIAVIDANDNGMLADAGDCTFTALVGSNGNLVINPSQGASPNPLRVCQGPCSGFAGFDSDNFFTTITGCSWNSLSPGAPFVPACMEFGSSVPDSSSSPCSVTNTGGGASGVPDFPVDVKAGRLFYPGFEFIIAEPGFGFLCNAGGPAVEIQTISGRRVVTDLKFIDGFVCVNMPFETVSGSKVLLDACLPLTDSGILEFSVGDGSPVAETVFTGLPSCGGRNAAPTASDIGLVALGLALLGFGAWKIGARRGFSASLPLL